MEALIYLANLCLPLDRPNLTVLTQALVTKLTLERKRAVGVEIVFDGKIELITAGLEIVGALRANLRRCPNAGRRQHKD
jgi:choline dehydrogenase-like flavoprotein